MTSAGEDKQEERHPGNCWQLSQSRAFTCAVVDCSLLTLDSSSLHCMCILLSVTPIPRRLLSFPSTASHSDPYLYPHPPCNQSRLRHWSSRPNKTIATALTRQEAM
jgi:hypothetical protein